MVQLADGYRLRGDTLIRNAGQLHGLPQEREYLQRAAEAYREALNRYLSLQDFTNVGSSIRAVQRSLDRVEERISEVAATPR